MLALCRRDGAIYPHEKEVQKKIKRLLEAHSSVVPSLVHGDLWSGNQGWTTQGEPVIFDPAPYYGDREVDYAMTKLFGANSRDFYEEINKIWPMAPGWEVREIIYNSYHILNHYVLFGGSYGTQAFRMLDTILASPEP